MATPDAMPTTVSIADINPERAGILKGALFGVLRSDAAQKVIAQAIDGLPIREAYELTTTKRFELFTRHEPSQDSMTRAKEFCTYSEMFDNLELNARVAHLYQFAPLNSHFFNMHLLELVAIAIHDFVGNIFTSCHPDGEPPLEKGCRTEPLPKDAVSLSTMYYTITDRYPKGLADTVGYWAETHIFGGVVLFDRGSVEGARNCFEAYLHPPCPKEIFQLLDSQLAQFASPENQGEPLTLPFTCDPKAKKVDHTKAFLIHNIYRDRYERVVSSMHDQVRIEDVRGAFLDRAAEILKEMSEREG